MSERDADPAKSILADLTKLIGIQGMEKTITYIEEHKNVKYFDKEGITKTINNPLFSNLEILNEYLYEVQIFKKSVF